MDSAPEPTNRADPTDTAGDVTERDARSGLGPSDGPVDPVASPPADLRADAESDPAPSLAKWLLIYSLLRIGLLVVLAAVLSLLMPLILALLFAILLALPLSWVIFGGVRRRVNVAMANSTAQRRAERERLRSALNGQEQR